MSSSYIPVIYLVLASCCPFCLRAEKYEIKGKAILAALSAKASTWKAKLNPEFVGKDEAIFKKLLGAKEDVIRIKVKKRTWNPRRPAKGVNRTEGLGTGIGQGSSRRRRQTSLPQNYDWRDHTSCQSFRRIRYQTCADCWAVAAAAVISDRYCLYNWQDRPFSARQIVSCVYGSNGGCDGGYPDDAMKYYVNYGVASGGDPTLNEPVGCLPYPRQMSDAYTCSSACDSRYALDRLRGGASDTYTSRSADDIKWELYTYGSVVACFAVYEDFYYYGGGVYQYSYGQYVGMHAVRLIGYGVENGYPYWLGANQWGTRWGDGGFFKMIRGYNHLYIESYVSMVYPPQAF